MSKKIKFTKLRLTRSNKGTQSSSNIKEFFDKSNEKIHIDNKLKNSETVELNNTKIPTDSKSTLEKLYDQTTKEIRKAKSPNKEPENVITEFFKTNEDHNDSFCDFQVSTKTCLTKPKVALKQKRRKTKKKCETSINKFINQGNDEILFNKLLVYQSTIEKVDPEQLQLAMELSKSMEEIQGPPFQQENCLKKIPTTQERLGNIRSTLEQFGFKKNSNIDYDLPVFLGINKKNKFSKKWTKLIKRNEEKQKEKLLNRVQNLLKNQFVLKKCFYDKQTNFILCSDYLTKYISKERKIFSMNAGLGDLQINEYYTGKLFTPTKIKSGHLLKNWNLIPGREISPTRDSVSDRIVTLENDEYIISIDEDKRELFTNDECNSQFDHDNQNQELRSVSPSLFSDLDESLTKITFIANLDSSHTFHHNDNKNAEKVLTAVVNEKESIVISDDEITDEEEKSNLSNNSSIADSNETVTCDISKMENILLSMYVKKSNDVSKTDLLVTDNLSLLDQFEELYESLTPKNVVNNEEKEIPEKENSNLSHSICNEKENNISNNEINILTTQDTIEIKSILNRIGFQPDSEKESDLPIFVGVFIPKSKTNNKSLNIDCGEPSSYDTNTVIAQINNKNKKINDIISSQNKIESDMYDKIVESINISDDECDEEFLENVYNGGVCNKEQEEFSLPLKQLIKYYNLHSLKESDVLYQKLISTNDDAIENDFHNTFEKLVINTIENDEIDKLQLSLCKSLNAEMSNKFSKKQRNSAVEDCSSMQGKIKSTLEKLGFKTYKNIQYDLPIFVGVFIPKNNKFNETVNSCNESIISNSDYAKTDKDFHRFRSFLSSPTLDVNKEETYTLKKFTSICKSDINDGDARVELFNSDDEFSSGYKHDTPPKIIQHVNSAFECIEISDDEFEVANDEKIKNINCNQSFFVSMDVCNDSNETIKYDFNDIEYEFPSSKFNTTREISENISLTLPNNLNSKKICDNKLKTTSSSFKKSLSMNLLEDKNNESIDDLYNKYDADLNDTIDNLVNSVNKKYNDGDTLKERNVKPISEYSGKRLTKMKSESFLLQNNIDNKKLGNENKNSQISLSQTDRSRKLKRNSSNLSYDRNDDENYKMKTRKLSPEPRYNNMTEIELNEELKRYGLKSLRKKNAINILEYIYNTTHPFIEDYDYSSNDDNSEQGENEEEDLNGDLNSVCKLNQISNDFNEFNPNINFTPNNIEEDLALYVLPSQPNKKLQTCLLPFHIAFKNFLACNKNINENLLQYKPLNIIKIRKFFKFIGIKYKLNEMKDFFDLHGIIFDENLEKPEKNSRKFCIIKL